MPLSLLLTGDSILQRRLNSRDDPELRPLFDKVRAADVAFTNLEGLANDYRGDPALESGGSHFGAPAWVLDELMNRLQGEMAGPPSPERICQGTLLSRAQYLVDIEHWGYLDARVVEGHMQQADIDLWTDAIATEQPTPATRPVYRSE